MIFSRPDLTPGLFLIEVLIPEFFPKKLVLDYRE